ncbi:universal stress protein [Nocardioides marmoraquaticus]
MAMAEVRTSLDVDGQMVVGCDGSRASLEAVRWADRLAHRLGEPLHVVRSWVLSTAPRPGSATVGYVPPMTDFEAAVLDELRRDVDALRPRSEVTLHTVHGSAGRRMVEASARASAIVVGNRGGGGFLGLRMGSTADQVVRNAHCPVVVVPVEADDGPDPVDAAATE